MSAADIKALKERNVIFSVNKKAKVIRDAHTVSKMYRESNWPYTEDLTLPEIACLRDTVAGHRKQPSIQQAIRTYDRRQPQIGWDPHTQRSDRPNHMQVMRSAQDEEKFRLMPLTTSAQYGHRFFTFYDCDTKERQGDKFDIGTQYYDATDKGGDYRW